MIEIIPNNGDVMAIYRGRLIRSQPGKPGQDHVVLDGTPVRYEELDALFSEDMLFDWRGQRFKLYNYIDQVLHGIYLSSDQNWARENGLDGSYHMGWYCHASESEVENVWVEKVDLLARRMYQNEVGEKPPEGTCQYLRPATPEEWIRTDSDSSS